MSTLNQELRQATAATIAAWRRPLLLTHAKPDGDALGALVAMRRLSELTGADPTALLFDDLPARYDIFRRYGPWPVWGRSVTADDLRDVDAVIVLDTCTYSQLEPIADWLREADVPKLAIDHHVTRDDLADHYLVDESAAATCLILYEWARTMDWPMSAEVNEALFVGIAMDTGWFRHSNTDERVLRAAADLVHRGVRPHELFQPLFQNESPGRVRLLGAALETLELLCDDRLAVMALSAEAIKEVGASPADTEDIINEPLRIESVIVAVFLVETGDGVVRASFRSKPPLSDSPELSMPITPGSQKLAGLVDIDVAQIANSFGGGGHKRAAGAKLRGQLDVVRRRIVERLQDSFSR